FTYSVAIITRMVRDAIDGGKRHQMIAPVQSSDDDRANGQFFYRTKQPGDLDHIVLVHAIFQLDKNTRDDVLNKLLSPKTNGQTNHPCPSNQRPNIDP